MKEKQYQRNDVYIPQLQAEIESSGIIIALDFIDINSNVLTVGFKSDITEEIEALLDQFVNSHTPDQNSKPSVVPIRISQPSTSEDDIPYVYNTTKPTGYYVCFQGAGDVMTENPNDGIGKGTDLSFKLTSEMGVMVKDFMFNEDVYIKDGYMIVQDAPFGATLDIEIIHPLIGILFPFARNIPILGSGWFPLDTEDRGFLPKGLILRVAVRNSNPSECSTHDEPCNFRLYGRFELFRKKPPGL